MRRRGATAPNPIRASTLAPDRGRPGATAPRRPPPRPRSRAAVAPSAPPARPVDARRVALEALARVDAGAYANLAVRSLLDGSTMSPVDRHFVTTLVNGTTRLRRALDWRIDAHAKGPLDPETRRVLRMGAYQLTELRVPAHAAVYETVRVAPRRSQGLVNAVLRRVAEAPEPAWPSEAVRLSYPDWIVDRLYADLGSVAAETLDAMNAAPAVHTRDDGYVQSPSSQAVAALVEARPGDRVLDLCAAPGGKATALAALGAEVVALDAHIGRARLILDTARRLGLNVPTVVADGRRPPLALGSFDHVLVDAPCSGLGALHRRPDARWRIQPADVDDLVVLQRQLLAAAVTMVRAGGTLTYSVCTLSRAESTGIDEWMAVAHPRLAPMPVPPRPWSAHGRGAMVLPQWQGGDGMCVFRYRLIH